MLSMLRSPGTRWLDCAWRPGQSPLALVTTSKLCRLFRVTHVSNWRSPSFSFRLRKGGSRFQLRTRGQGAVCDGRGVRHGPRAASHAPGALLRIPGPLPAHGQQHRRQGAAQLHSGRQLQRWVACRRSRTLTQAHAEPLWHQKWLTAIRLWNAGLVLQITAFNYIVRCYSRVYPPWARLIQFRR